MKVARPVRREAVEKVAMKLLRNNTGQLVGGLPYLTHIRKRTEQTVRRSQRREQSAWAFRQLRTFIAYKALLAGVAVAYIDPRNTSRTCSQPDCGYCDKRNRRDQARFRCLKCGFAAPADHNAAINISRAAVNQPIVSDTHRVTPGTSCPL